MPTIGWTASTTSPKTTPASQIPPVPLRGTHPSSAASIPSIPASSPAAVLASPSARRITDWTRMETWSGTMSWTRAAWAGGPSPVLVPTASRIFCRDTRSVSEASRIFKATSSRISWRSVACPCCLESTWSLQQPALHSVGTKLWISRWLTLVWQYLRHGAARAATSSNKKKKLNISCPSRRRMSRCNNLASRSAWHTDHNRDVAERWDHHGDGTKRRSHYTIV